MWWAWVGRWVVVGVGGWLVGWLVGWCGGVVEGGYTHNRSSPGWMAGPCCRPPTCVRCPAMIWSAVPGRSRIATSMTCGVGVGGRGWEGCRERGCGVQGCEV